MKSMAESDSTDDARVDLRKRARRRLVGAVALALLAIIVLPMVMDEEPKPLTQEIQIRIPSPDSAAPVARAPAPSAVQDAAAPPVAEAKTPQKPEVPSAPPPAESKPEAKPESAKAAQESKAEAKPEAQPESKAAAKPELKPAESGLTAKADTKSEQWVVQLGAYQEQGNVKLLLAKVKELGYPAYTEKVDTERGVRTRVRAGPFATREKAEKAQAALKRIGAGGPSGGIVGPK